MGIFKCDDFIIYHIFCESLEAENTCQGAKKRRRENISGTEYDDESGKSVIVIFIVFLFAACETVRWQIEGCIWIFR